ncbi:MAG: EAL domain-containing protein, partial [Ilumatobacteraceae bacterium]
MNPPVLRSPELSAEGLAATAPQNACDREPIHLSGAIQPHGFLLVVDAVSLVVTAASANVPPLLGGYDDPLGVKLGDVLGEDTVRTLHRMHPTGNPHDGLSEPVRLHIPQRATDLTYDMIPHRRGRVLVLEFEQDSGNSGAPAARFFRDAMNDLATGDEVEEICALTVREVRRLTGYDRVMIYRFAPDGHGHVIAEECRDGAEPFLGLHYPASDIPHQARALYLRNWIRVIADAAYVPVAINALPGGIPVDQIDLSMSVLRSVSPVHLEYLRNMGVRATMTISLIVDNQLWGMIACHHDTPKLAGHSQRLACESLGQLVSMRVRSAEVTGAYARARRLAQMAATVVAAMSAGEGPALGAAAAKDALLGMVAADGAVVEIEGTRVSVGTVPTDEEVEALVAHLGALAGAGPEPLANDSVSAALVGGNGELDDGSPATGTLFLPLPGRADGFVLWMRGDQTRTVRWAGRPQDKSDSGTPETMALSPRASFAEWRERVRGHSRPWQAAEITTAQGLAEAMPEVLLHRAQNRLVWLALYDSLTGIPNRAQLNDRLDEMLDLSSVEPGGAADRSGRSAVLFIDLDGFKAVNDTYGHLVGDEVLTLVARRITALVRPHDIVGRLGGDEFVVLAPDTGPREAAAMAQRIVDDFHQPLDVRGYVITSVTLSVGVTVVEAGTEPLEAVRQADSAMYHAKRSGRNQVATYDPASGSAATSDQISMEELSSAIDAGEIIVHYQPIFALVGDASSVLDGYEALARWEHPTRGLVAPADFVGLAEQTGLIDALGRSVLLQALRQLRGWEDRRQTMAVNISVCQLVRPGFTAAVVAHLSELGISPARLCLEVTESQIMEQPALARAALGDLAAANVKIAIDHFGTGSSSLAYVRELPATYLKIDKLFVSGLTHHAPDVAVVRATVQLAHALGMRTIAAGVETGEQLAMLREL